MGGCPGICRDPGPGPGPGLRATGQSGLGYKSAGQSRKQNPAGQQIPTSRDKNPGQSLDGPADGDKKSRDCPFSSFAHPLGEQALSDACYFP